ncbi:hypothetical protein AB6A40_003344 [Gnathostoma spinigerum]|uniref:Uncharacterized protein n=1 Tax=Gnathostoma spinigerum TaxID=75299 RepID=A0ABD6EK48_9BILA
MMTSDTGFAKHKTTEITNKRLTFIVFVISQFLITRKLTKRYGKIFSTFRVENGKVVGFQTLNVHIESPRNDP